MRPFFAMQHDQELAEFCELVRESNVVSYLEIGAKFGGTFWEVGQALCHGARMVAVDLPHGTVLWEESQASLQKCAEALEKDGREVHLIWGDSIHPHVVERVRMLGPYDLVFIDANHTKHYIEADWANYGALAQIVAFHDISWRRPAEWKGVRIDVPAFWDKIKVEYRHRQIVLDPKRKDNGIGVLWRT